VTVESGHESKSFSTDFATNLGMSANDIVNDMEKIRKDTLLRYSTLAKRHARLDDYIHLAYRLGTYMAATDKESLTQIPDIVKENELFTFFNYGFLKEIFREQFDKMDQILTTVGKKIGIEGHNYHLFQGFVSLVELKHVSPYYGGMELDAVNEIMPELSRKFFERELRYICGSVYENGTRKSQSNCFILGELKDKRCLKVKDCSEHAISGCNKFKVIASAELVPEKGIADVAYVRFPTMGWYDELERLEKLVSSLGYSGILFNTTQRGFAGLRQHGYSVVRTGKMNNAVAGTTWKPLHLT
jgi:hypothetical protein